jgi:hypothetical protein
VKQFSSGARNLVKSLLIQKMDADGSFQADRRGVEAMFRELGNISFGISHEMIALALNKGSILRVCVFTLSPSLRWSAFHSCLHSFILFF